MRKFIFFAVLAFAACSTPANPVLLQDGQLAVGALTVIESDAKLLNAPAADIAAIDTGINVLQTGLNDLKAGTKTPNDFARLANDEITVLSPIMLDALHANATMRLGVTLLQQLVTVIAADVTAANTAPTAASIDTRGRVRVWMEGQRK